MTVQDAITKSPVVVKVSPDSQMKKLPSEMAQRIAMRLKGGAGQAADGKAEHVPAQAESGAEAGGGAARGTAGAQGGGNGAPDLQRFLGRLPDSKLADLQKGDAVMIVATADADSAGRDRDYVAGGSGPDSDGISNPKCGNSLSVDTWRVRWRRRERTISIVQSASHLPEREQV